MDIERLKGLPILKAHFKKLANTSKAAYADLKLPYPTVGVVYWEEEDSWVVCGYFLHSIRAIKSETKDRGYKIDALYFADKFEAKNYNGDIVKLLRVAVEAYANPENKIGASIEGIFVVELDFNDDPVYFLMEDNAFQDELTKDEFCELLEYKCETISIPEGTTTIEDKSFANYTDLKSIVIPSSIKTIEKEGFSKCISLKSITIEGPVEKIEECAFEGCTSLKTLTLAAGIKKISKKAFVDCTAIERINVPAKKANYYKKRLPESLHGLIVELPAEKKAKKK